MLLKRWQLLKEVMADNNLNPSALRVMYFLLNRENSKTKALFPSHMRLSTDTNLCERSVRRGIDNLIHQNYLIKLKKGGPGRATTYQINYKQRTVLSKTEDSIVKNIRTDMSDQSTNKSIYKSSVANLINKVAKNSNANYKAVVNGLSQKYSSDERTYQRILKKTQDPHLAEEWLKLRKSKNWNDKVRAEQIAKHLQCL